ncbi:MAG TPA: very short patch repair endonuclease, partial [Candidatus Binataceae bacterium]|nr:very short patch repair endonuclease [Candidatus Binataceae bacterium]
MWKYGKAVTLTGTASGIFRMDRLTPEHRSRLMAAVRGKNTGPEMIVRRLVHRLGRRYRLHRKDLPGKPDLVFPRLERVLFIHGCFWHRHKGCRWATSPKSHVAFWRAKFRANQS